MLYIMRFKVVIGSTISQGRECVFGFKTEQFLPNEETWKLAVRNVLLQLKPNEYMESLKLESVTTE